MAIEWEPMQQKFAGDSFVAAKSTKPKNLDLKPNEPLRTRQGLPLICFEWEPTNPDIFADRK